jgi:hypothetical protein
MSYCQGHFTKGVDAHWLAIILSSSRFQKVEGVICMAKPFKMIVRSGDIADIEYSVSITQIKLATCLTGIIASWRLGR